MWNINGADTASPNPTRPRAASRTLSSGTCMNSGRPSYPAYNVTFDGLVIRATIRA